MKQRFSRRLTVIVLLLGVCGGLWGLSYGKTWFKQELIEIIRDEARKSCDGCDIHFDSISLSLITLSASGKGASFTRNDHVAFRVEDLKAEFSLAKIFSRKVVLSQLDLNGVHIDGIGEKSATYQFIDYITTSKSSGGSEPLLKIHFMGLTLRNGSFTEKFTSSSLEGGDVFLQVSRTADDNFILLPKIKRLELSTPNETGKRTRYLGQVTGRLTIENKHVVFHSVDITREDAKALVHGISNTLEGNALQAELTSSFDTASVDFDDVLLGEFSVLASLAGTLGRPTALGTISLDSVVPGHIILNDSKVVTFDSLSGGLNFDLRDKRPIVTLNNVIGTGPGVRVKPDSTFVLDDEKFGGELHLQTENLTFAGFDLAQVDAVVAFRGDISVPRVEVILNGEDLRYLGYSVGPARVKAVYENNRVQLEVADISAQMKERFQGSGSIDLTGETAALNNFMFTFEQLRLKGPVNDHPVEQILLSGNGTLKGPLTLEGVEGRVELSAAYSPPGLNLEGQEYVPYETVAGTLVISEGDIVIDTSNQNRSFAIKGFVDLPQRRRSELRFITNSWSPNITVVEDLCLRITSDITYKYDYSYPLLGDGEVRLGEAKIGCDIFQGELVPSQSTLPIKEGKLDLSGAMIRGVKTALELNGKVSILEGYDFKTLGHIELEAFAGLFPNLDNFSGSITAALDIQGPLTTPLLKGKAEVERIDLSSMEAKVSILDTRGKVTFDGDAIVVDELSGLFNGGLFSLEGTLSPFSLLDSEVTLQFQDALFANWQELEVALSGRLNLTAGDLGKPLVKGAIDISGAELEKNFDIKELVSVLESFFSSQQVVMPTSYAFPDVELDLAVGAANNILVNSNWLQTELRADVKVGGSLSAPILTGTLETLSGWFGLRNRRFDLTSGLLRFSPGRYLPNLDVIAESTLRSRTGETIAVILELSGPLESPTVVLSSDRGLPQQELIRMLASSQGGSFTDTSSGLGLGLEYRGFGIGEEESGLGSLLYELTRLDNLSLEPAYNSLTGSLEPSIFAEKHINDWISLTGRGVLTQNFSQSDASLNFSLTDKLSAIGSVRSQSSQDEVAIESNLRYTIFTSQQQLLQVSISGNDYFSDGEIKKLARLQENSRIDTQEVKNTAFEIRNGYREAGYYEAQVKSYCREVAGLCRELVIKIKEGSRSKVDTVRIEGALPEKFSSEKTISRLREQTFASESHRKNMEKYFLRLLRREGYIGARVAALYEDISGKSGKILILQVRSGRPVTFLFEGNERFSAEDLLQTINLFGRTQPFGNNSIAVLIRNIERIYREDGYLYATITSEESTDESSGRKLYKITINEGPHIRVENVTFSGLENYSEEDIKGWLEATGVPVDEIFSSRYAVEEVLAEVRRRITEGYRYRGFSEVKVTSDIVPSEEIDRVDIRYTVEEGSQQAFDTLNVSGLPSYLQWDALGSPPYAVPQLNLKIEKLHEFLREEGFLHGELWTELDYDNKGKSTAILNVNPGVRTIIKDIIISGASNIDESVVRRVLPIKPGDPWRREYLDETRRSLFRLGLFARVDLTAADKEVDSEEEILLINLKERSLRSLKVGTGVNSIFGLHFFSEAFDKGIFSDGRTVSLRLDAYYDPQGQEISQGIANLAYTNPQLFGLNLSHVEDISFQRVTQLNQEYELARVALGSLLYIPAYRSISFSAGHTLSVEDVSEVSPDAILSELDSGQVRLSFLSGSFIYDRRNDALNPGKGFALKVDYKLAHELMASEANFASVDTKLSVIRPLRFISPRAAVAFSSRFGFAETYGDTSAVPITQRFYLGGRNTVRGFRENSLGPRGDLGSVIGGDMLQSNTLELRYQVANNAWFHTFLDSGNVFLQGVQDSIDKQRVATGVGIRYQSPIGPVGFDIGHPLDEREGEPSLRFHFAIGSNF